MEQKPRIVAFIPARGGSKSIPLKNIKNIAGKPLIGWTLEAAVNAAIIDHVYVATDSQEIKNYVQERKFSKVSVIARSPESATDTASSELALLEFCQNYKFDYVFFIQATSPLFESKDLNLAWKKLLRTKTDSLLSVVNIKRFIWEDNGDGIVKPINYNPFKRPRRQDFQGLLVENGAFYLSKRIMILDSQCRISGKISSYTMSDDAFHEIDEPSDWAIVENTLIQKKRKYCKRNIKAIITDVDGVLTDAGMYYGENCDELKKFNTRDGMAVQILREHDFIVGIITGEDTVIVKNRAKKLNIQHLHVGCKNKLLAAKQICEKEKIQLENIAFIGDDINDIELIENVGVSFCPQNAVSKVKIKSDYILQTKGGEGCLREVVDIILGNEVEYD